MCWLSDIYLKMFSWAKYSWLVESGYQLQWLWNRREKDHTSYQNIMCGRTVLKIFILSRRWHGLKQSLRNIHWNLSSLKIEWKLLYKCVFFWEKDRHRDLYSCHMFFMSSEGSRFKIKIRNYPYRAGEG